MLLDDEFRFYAETVRTQKQNGRYAGSTIIESPDLLGYSGATRRIRTDDLLITNQLLYRLS